MKLFGVETEQVYLTRQEKYTVEAINLSDLYRRIYYLCLFTDTRIFYDERGDPFIFQNVLKIRWSLMLRISVKTSSTIVLAGFTMAVFIIRSVANKQREGGCGGAAPGCDNAFDYNGLVCPLYVLISPLLMILCKGIYMFTSWSISISRRSHTRQS